MKRSGDVDAALRAVAERHALPADAAPRLRALLEALAAEPDPQTTVSEPAAAADRHVADSLEALRVDAVRAARTIADVGSGAGFPALPLAVALPTARVDLLESQRRKCAVAERLATAAGADNAIVRPVRAEAWAAGAGRGRYDVVTARAVAPLAVLVEYAAPLLREGGLLVAWKGALDPVEAAAARAGASTVGMAPGGELAAAPYAEARALTLHLYRKVAPTPARFPRRPGVAAKRPLGAAGGQREPSS